MCASWEAEESIVVLQGAFKEVMWSVNCDVCSYACGCESENGTCGLSASSWCKKWFF